MRLRSALLVSSFVPAVLAAQEYTVAFNSFAPADSDVFIAGGDGSNPRPIASHRALDYNASFSPDGAWVVFTSDRDGSADIYRARVDGSSVERIVDDPAFDDQAALSPDGMSVAFVSSRSGHADVWILDLVTRRARNLTNAPSGEFRPAWSPGGEWLAFVSDRDAPRTTCAGSGATTGPGPFVTPQYTGVFVVRADGTSVRRVSEATEVAGSPTWTRDGAEVVFYTAAHDQVCNGGLMFANGTSQIVSVDVASGERTALTTGEGVKLFPRVAGAGTVAFVTSRALAFAGEAREVAGQFGRPAWSPDGRLMVFHRDIGRRDAGAVEKASPDPRFGLVALPGQATFSPDGRRMAFPRTNFAGASVGNAVLVVADADGSNQREIFESSPADNLTAPAWSPRGDAIVFGVGAYFRRAGAAPARLMSIRPDGSGLVDLSDGTTNDGMPSWSPQGNELLFRVADGPARGIHVLDVESGARRPFATGSDRDTFPYWSPRGDWITFTSNRDGDYEIYRIRPDGTDVRRLTTSPGHDAHSSVSPDGEWIAFATGRQGFKDEALGLTVGARPPPFQSYGEIAVMRVDGSELRLLTDNAIEEGVPVWLSRE